MNVQAVIVTLEQQAGLIQTAIDALRALGAAPAVPKLAKIAKRSEPVKTTRRAPLVDGSLNERIVSMLREAGEPTKKAFIVKHAGALEADVVKALKELVADARIVRTGVTAAVRFQLP